MTEYHVQSSESAHGEPDDVSSGGAGGIEHRDGVAKRMTLRVGRRVGWNVRGRVSTRCVCDAPIRLREVDGLGRPPPVTAGKLVHEKNREAPPALLVVELDGVGAPSLRHP